MMAIDTTKQYKQVAIVLPQKVTPNYFANLAQKATPLSTDEVLLIDNAAAGAAKRSTIAQVLNNTIVDAAWTPALSFGGASVGITYTSQLGRYIKIGNAIIVAGMIVLSNKGSSSGNAAISLPVTVNANFNSFMSAYWADTAIGLISVGLYPVSASASALVMGAAAAAANPSILTNTAFNHTTQIRFGGVYFT